MQLNKLQSISLFIFAQLWLDNTVIKSLLFLLLLNKCVAFANLNYGREQKQIHIDTSVI